MFTSSNLIRAAPLIILLASLFPFASRGQKSASTRHFLVLYWYNKDFPGNAAFDQQFQAALRSGSPAGIEYYSEYLEDNRFPGENQSVFLRDYLRQKYAGRLLDVVVTNTPPTLSFLLENRDVLFPRAPIVFATTDLPPREELLYGPGATGIVYAFTHAKTLDLALRLHPNTEQVFVVHGAIDGDRTAEVTARQQLRAFEDRVKIDYVTNLPLRELIEKTKRLPRNSIVLYVRQRALDQRGGIVESREVLSLIARQCPVPIYGLSYANIGLGIVGGYAWTIEGNASKTAEIALRVANGARAADIPVEPAPDVPLFDWRQLQRWGIREDRLPPGSVIQFRELTFWQMYKWRIVAAIGIFTAQAFLIGALLLARRRAGKSRVELERYKDGLEQLVKERTAEMVHARDQALAANRSKSTFLANMSHELRTPLNAILGFTDLILRRGNLPQQDLHDLALVGNSGEHLLALIDDILDVAKIETGRATIESAPADLHSLVSDTVEMLRGRAQSNNLDLLLEIAPGVPRFIRTDAAKLRQVLTNLIGNAVKYTEQGRVMVRVDARSDEESSDGVLRFDVEDTGIGIPPEDQARIFDPFIQAAKTRSVKGTGLGLSISRNFVRLLGGSIEVRSAVGQGSRFRVEIPAIPGPAVETAAPAGEGQVASVEPGQPEWRILIVEDQKVNWLLLERLLKTTGFLVRVVEDGGQAVAVFQSWHPHFIWMDLRLPVLGGLEAAKQIRELEGGRDVKIVALTASAFASQRDEVLAAGFDGFLRKPYRPREIFDCMARQLGVRYRYAALPEDSATDLPGHIGRQDIEALPSALRHQLEDAVISLDRERVTEALARVFDSNPTLGAALRPLTDQYRYTAILDALRGTEDRASTGSR